MFRRGRVGLPFLTRTTRRTIKFSINTNTNSINSISISINISISSNSNSPYRLARPFLPL